MTPEIHYLDDEQVLVSRGPLIMRIIERAHTEAGDVDRVFELAQRVARVHGEVGVMIVSHHGAPVPGPASLRYMAQTIPRMRELGASVFVMLGMGFWSMAAQRSIIALADLAGMPVPVTTVLEDGARELHRLVPSIDAAAVLTTYESTANKMTIGPSRA